MKNQIIEPRRRDSLPSADDAAAAVERLRSLQQHERTESRDRTLLGLRPFVTIGVGAIGLLVVAVFFVVSILPRAGEGLSIDGSAVSAAGAPGAEEFAQIDQGNLENPATGSGYVQITREKDFTHPVREGETFSEIAYFYGIDSTTLASYNRLANPDQLRIGQTLVIPSINHEQEARTRPAPIPQSTAQPSVAIASAPAVVKTSARTPNATSNEPLVISAEEQFDGTAITAHFSIVSPAEADFSSFEWDLGNRRKSFRENPYWTYEQPGTYTVTLRARTRSGQLFESNPVYVDVPHPASRSAGSQRFITLGTFTDTFRMDGEISAVSGYESIASSPIVQVGTDEDFGIYQSNEAGFFTIHAHNSQGNYTVYLFVSPIPTVHTDRADMNWYRTQFNTGTLSNCGPATVAMAFAWAKGDYLPVSSVREAVGFQGNGGTSFEQLIKVLKNNGVDARMTVTRKAQDIFDIIDQGNIAVALINTLKISRTRSNPGGDLFGRYYNDDVGHYIIVKGYSIDKKYLVVYDPIPSDWSSNSYRYNDGISMMGRNRYYPISEVLGSMRRADVMEIRR